jgi:hypothetical protein
MSNDHVVTNIIVPEFHLKFYIQPVINSFILKKDEVLLLCSHKFLTVRLLDQVGSSDKIHFDII